MDGVDRARVLGSPVHMFLLGSYWTFICVDYSLFVTFVVWSVFLCSHFEDLILPFKPRIDSETGDQRNSNTSASVNPSLTTVSCEPIASFEINVDNIEIEDAPDNEEEDATMKVVNKVLLNKLYLYF